MNRYRSCGKRVTDSSQAVVYLLFRLRSNRHIPCVQSERATLPILNHIPQTFSLSFALFCRRLLARKKKRGIYQCCYKFWLWIFLFCNFFFQNFFFQIFFPKFFFQNFFSKIFFSKFFFEIFFPKIFFPKFFFNFLKNFFFFEGSTLDASPFTETKRTLFIYVMQNMISMRSKLDFSLVWVFFGSYCSHHTRREKFNSFLAKHNILLYFFKNLLYLIEVLKCFLDGI